MNPKYSREAVEVFHHNFSDDELETTYVGIYPDEDAAWAGIRAYIDVYAGSFDQFEVCSAEAGRVS